MHTATAARAARTRTPDAEVRRVLARAGVTRVIITRGLLAADSAAGEAVQAASLTAALAALTAAGIPTARDEDYPTFMAHVTGPTGDAPGALADAIRAASGPVSATTGRFTVTIRPGRGAARGLWLETTTCEGEDFGDVTGFPLREETPQEYVAYTAALLSSMRGED